MIRMIRKAWGREFETNHDVWPAWQAAAIKAKFVSRLTRQRQVACMMAFQVDLEQV